MTAEGAGADAERSLATAGQGARATKQGAVLSVRLYNPRAAQKRPPPGASSLRGRRGAPLKRNGWRVSSADAEETTVGRLY